MRESFGSWSHHYRPLLSRVVAAAVLLGALGIGHARGIAEPDWAALTTESTRLLADLIRADTSNPPGNETAAARVLARWLARDGIAAEVLESSPGRGNLHARLRGRGSGRPVVLLSHLDVVPADGAAWSHPPFAGYVRDGAVWGRGALDAKGLATIQAMAVVALRRSGVPLARDVILLATADEETGGRAGAGWLVRERPELVTGAEFLFTEGEHVHDGEGSTLVSVAVAEKTPCWVELVASGEAGHGSTPPADTAVTRLVAALERIRRYPTAVRVIPAVAAYFAALAPGHPEPLRTRLADLARAVEDPAFRDEFLRNPRQNALVRTTITPTVLAGSPKTNVIPAEARAQLDCRLLPGDTPDRFLTELRSVIADDSIRVEPLLSFPASASPPDSPAVAAIRTIAATEFPGAPVVPSVIPGFTDSHYFRELGIASYGFVPFVLTDDDQRTVHGIDEHVGIENLQHGVRRLVALLRALDGPAPHPEDPRP